MDVVHPVFQARGMASAAHAVLRISWHPKPACKGTVRMMQSITSRNTAAVRSSGRRGRRIAVACGRRGTAAYYAAKACYPGKQAFATDACVPISRLADCVLESKADADRERDLSRRSSATSATATFIVTGAVRPGQARAERAKAEATGQARKPARHRDGRDLHRRTRHRRPQARGAGGRTRRGGRTHADHQACARPAQHHESRARLSLPTWRHLTCTRSTSATRTTRRGRCAAGLPRGCPARPFAKSRSSCAEPATRQSRVLADRAGPGPARWRPVHVWDSLAISGIPGRAACLACGRPIRPREPGRARSPAEMHSSFAAMRNDMTMCIRERCRCSSMVRCR